MEGAWEHLDARLDQMVKAHASEAHGSDWHERGEEGEFRFRMRPQTRLPLVPTDVFRHARGDAHVVVEVQVDGRWHRAGQLPLTAWPVPASAHDVRLECLLPHACAVPMKVTWAGATASGTE